MSKKLTKETLIDSLTHLMDDFDEEMIREVIAEYADGEYAHRYTMDCPDPGPELNVNEECHVPLEALGELERIIDPENNLLPAHFLEEGAQVLRPVGRVVVPNKWKGTGSMVSDSLLLTNNHVLPTRSISKKCCPRNELSIQSSRRCPIY